MSLQYLLDIPLFVHGLAASAFGAAALYRPSALQPYLHPIRTMDKGVFELAPSGIDPHALWFRLFASASALIGVFVLLAALLDNRLLKLNLNLALTIYLSALFALVRFEFPDGSASALLLYLGSLAALHLFSLVLGVVGIGLPAPQSHGAHHQRQTRHDARHQGEYSTSR